MWDEDWARLGIEPTPDLTAIKRAYALKLKVTRPDDDAEAYQALRGAYERVQQWAAWERSQPTQVPAMPDTTPPEHPAAAAAPEPMPTGSTPAALPPERLEAVEVLEPRTVIEALELAWRRGGEDALMQAWHEARATLNAQPLARRGELSAAFAQWLVNLPQLPDPIARALDDHFSWQGDFRTERLIGPALAQEVHATLAERFPPPVDAGLRAAAEPLLRVAALRETGRWGVLHLALLMLHPTLAQLNTGLGSALLRRLGLDLAAQSWLRTRIQRGLWMRVGLCVALVGAAAWLKAGDAAAVISALLSWAVGAGLVMIGGVFVGSFINKGPGLTVGGRRRELPLTAWRQSRLQPMLGLAWLLFAGFSLGVAGVVRFEPTAAPTASLVPHWVWLAACPAFALAGLFTAWPLVPLHGLVVATLIPFAALLFASAFGEWIPPGSAALIGVAWLLGGAAVAVRRTPAPTWVIWLCRPIINTLMLAEQWSYGFAMLAPAAAFAWLTLQGDETRPLTLFAIWALGLVLLGRLQARLDRAALRRLPPLPTTADGA